jgi:hypothetical protein
VSLLDCDRIGKSKQSTVSVNLFNCTVDGVTLVIKLLNKHSYYSDIEMSASGKGKGFENETDK